MFGDALGPCSNCCRTKKELDAIEVDETELEDQIQVHGSYKKPEPMDLAIVQFWLLPIYIYKSIAWHVRWLRRYQFGNEEYTEEDKEYIVRCGIQLCYSACMLGLLNLLGLQRFYCSFHTGT